jgi:uncharacterized membrane protein
MTMISSLQSILLGLMGWSATALLIINASRLTMNDRRAMTICSWMVWMIPAFGALVYHGVITTNTAALYCGATTLCLALLVIVTTVRQRTRP